MLQSLQRISWSNPIGDPLRNRADLIATLGLPPRDCGLATYQYFLRNQFLAHPGGWRWWDVNEFLDHNTFTSMSDLAKRVIVKADETEVAVRRIDPEPSSWSDWFLKNFPHIFRAVWFGPGKH